MHMTGQRDPYVLSFRLNNGAEITLQTSVELDFALVNIGPSAVEYRVDVNQNMASGVWTAPIAGTPNTFNLPNDCRAAPSWECTVTVHIQFRKAPTGSPPASSWQSPVLPDDIRLAFVHPDIEQLFADNPTADGNLNISFSPTVGAVVPGFTDKGIEDRDFRIVTELTGMNVVATSAGGPNDTGVRYDADVVDKHKQSFSLRNNNRVNGVRTIRPIALYNDIELALAKGQLAVLSYLQKPWSMNTGDDPQTEVTKWYDSGLRIVQLAYNKADNDRIRARLRGPYGGGSGEDAVGLTGLTPANPGPGRDTVQALFDHYMVVDLSHVGRRTTLDILNLADAEGRSVMANHVNACAITRWTRNKDDWEICRIARTGGVIGVTPIPAMVISAPQPAFVPPLPPNQAGFAGQCGAFVAPPAVVPTEQLVSHIEHLVNLDCAAIVNGAPAAAEMENHVSVATDSRIDTPRLNPGMSQTYRMKHLASFLYVHSGYSADRIRKIFGGNLLRVYSETLPRLFPPVPGTPQVVNPAGLPVTPVIFQWTAQWRGPEDREPKPIYQVVLELRAGAGWLPYATSSGTLSKKVVVNGLQTGQRYRWKVVRRGIGPDTESDWVEFLMP